MYGLTEHSSVESIFFSVVAVILQSSELYKKTEFGNALNVLIFISKVRCLDLYSIFFMLSIVRLFPLISTRFTSSTLAYVLSALKNVSNAERGFSDPDKD